MASISAVHDAGVVLAVLSTREAAVLERALALDVREARRIGGCSVAESEGMRGRFAAAVVTLREKRVIAAQAAGRADAASDLDSDEGEEVGSHRMLSAAEVGRSLGVGSKWVRVRAQRGEIPGHFDGYRWCFDEEVIKTWGTNS